MPHAAQWFDSDWSYAIDCLCVAANFYERGTPAAAAELRIRAQQMGATCAARRGLRIRYVAAVADSGDERSSVVELSDNRNL